MNSTRSAPTAQTDWADEVLRFWFTELSRQQWFASDATLDEQIRSRFREVYRMVAAALEDALLADDKTALAAVIVLDQFSRNMFRGTAGAFANDAKALAIAQKAIAKGFAGALSSDEQLFLYLPFEHQENVDAQARSVELISALGDPELTKYAQAHKDVIDRFGRFPLIIADRLINPGQVTRVVAAYPEMWALGQWLTLRSEVGSSLVPKADLDGA